MRYFLKRCGFQELGSIGEDGRAKRGRYLMSSQHEDVVDFFPPLSVDIPNDTAMLPIVPLYSMVKTYVSYVYHNSKYTGTNAKHPRNEYRIYLNNEVENHQQLFCAEDIVVIRKSENCNIDDNPENQAVFYLDVIKDHASSIYYKLNHIIDEYPIRGGYGIFEGVLDFFEKQIDVFESGKFKSNVLIDNTVTERIKKTTEKNQSNIFNPATFKDFVLAGYGNACAVTGYKAEGIFGKGVDVVYIKPKMVGGSCLPSNGIALVNRMSLAFVRGEFSLSDRFEILVHPDSKNDELKSYHLRQIHVPQQAFFRPDKENIQYHRDVLFGAFLKMGMIDK